MSPAEQAIKLREIARLDAGELAGWEDEATRDEDRPFPGERAALEERRRVLSKRRAA